jgi:tetratricopeptide (TPR) repeat protein
MRAHLLHPLLALGLYGLVFVLPAGPGSAAGGEPPPQAEAKPPWQRQLQGEDARRADQLQARINQLAAAGSYAESITAAQELAALRQRLQGADHWHAVDALLQVRTLQRRAEFSPAQQAEYRRAEKARREADALFDQGRYAQAQPLYEQALAQFRRLLGEEHRDSARACNDLAINLEAQGRYPEAAEGHRKVLALRRKVLGEEHPSTAQSYNNLASSLQVQGKYAEAEAGFRKAKALYQRLLGEEHPLTATACNNLAANLQAQARHAEAEALYRQALGLRRKLLGEEHPDTAATYNNLASNLEAQGKYAEAEAGYRKALALRRKLLGAEHPHTAQGYNNLAVNLDAQGKHAEAEELHRKALALCIKRLGEEHPDTATTYDNLALNLSDQGRYAEAEAGFRKALALRRKRLGEEHPDTATSYDNLAANFGEQGRYAEAEAGYRKALALRRQLLGEEHPSTAQGNNNLATNLDAQGRYAEAEALYRKALAVYQKLLGEEHPSTITTSDNLALNLDAQGRYAEAEAFHRQALDLRRKRLGEEHPDTATGSNNLAANLEWQGKYAQAEALHRQALALRRKRLGKEHPLTAQSSNNLAANLEAQGQYAEAEALYRQALDLRRQLLGEAHPLTALSYDNLAHNLDAQGRDREAEELLRRGADTFARTRLRFAPSGLGGAGAAGDLSPLPFLAALLARHGQPEQAWRRFEQGLGRGTWDDLQARLARSPQEQARLAGLTRRLDRLDQLLIQDGTLQEPIEEQTRRHKEWLAERRQAQDQLDALTDELARKYGLGEAQALPLEKVQAALPADAALLGWVDGQERGRAAEKVNERWAVLLRAKGPPAWVRLPGSGPGGAWTEADTRLPRELAAALRSRPRPGTADWRPLAGRLYGQRLAPLEPHLTATPDLPAVGRLVVLPSSAMDGIPLAVLGERYVFSHAASATVFAFLRGKERPHGSGLLALADPVFAPPDPTGVAPLPPGGVLLTAVVPGSGAAGAGLRPGDVLLRYHGAALRTSADLQARILEGAPDAKARVPVEVWRAGETFTAEVPPGALGVSVAREPAPEAVARRRRIDAEVLVGRDGAWKALPGTRAEAAAVAGRFRQAGRPVALLTGADASKQRLYEWARDGSLGKARYLHLATHGTVDWRLPLQSALVLSRDRLPDPGRQPDAGLSVYDGRLTAAEVLRDWDLDADLVTLSACATGLGRYARGEGYLGFAQALLLAGSRSVVLSLWQVDDISTALLMDRFYANLLGQRDGLTAAMGKADALAEAKAWLRALPRSEAVKRAAALTGGVERGAGREALPRAPVVPETAQDEPPYAHPYYWAAFVLVGDPG